MAVKRAKPKRTAKKKVVRKKLPAPPRMLMGPPGAGCNLGRICHFLHKDDGLIWWLKEFHKDYKALRIAVCNVEKQAFSGAGNAAKPPRFCSGGGGAEPADPPKPPDW